MLAFENAAHNIMVTIKDIYFSLIALRSKNAIVLESKSFRIVY